MFSKNNLIIFVKKNIMQVTVSMKSWHYKYFTWCMGYEPKFKSLCPYFWATAFLLFIAPVILALKLLRFVFARPGLAVADSIGNGVGTVVDTIDNNNVLKTILKGIGKIFVGIYITFIGLVVLFGIYTLFKENTVGHAFTLIGYVLGILAVVILILLGIFKFIESDTFDVISGMAYSLKNKVCPMLKYKD